MDTRLPIIIDCDPGHDDAIMLMLAFGSKLFDIKAVTISAGNQTQEKTLRNALRILTLIGAQPPVYKGSEKPLFRDLIIADYVHGKSGIDGTDLPQPAFEAEEGLAIDAIARIVNSHHEKITLVATGPLTNIAGFLLSYPDSKSTIEKIVLMGGGISRGNYTPLAEFNIYVDPEAASLVFNSGIPIVMCGLDVTHKALFFKDDIELFRAIGNKTGKAVAELVDFFSVFYRQNRPELGGGAALHDPCTIAWLMAPSIFQSKQCHVDVEVSGKLTTGATVVDFYNLLKLKPNTEVVYDLDRKAFVKMLYDTIKTLP
ncbi:MAG: nucleoside hydrolase [Ferruginibacter sp.]|nr:nucleoside hydrolase [Ferruginibacter sp.]